ncbi:uncharacterized protein LOC143544157 [Bidens hawaiensis]|uniref:uncharacterized protein LOC143544157 n=1 Tax=Bidens hawaiensis TaxID=980011 RepID=UPI004049A091
METTALSLKATIDKLFARHSLSIGRVRGKGYDGASNMSELANLKNVVSASCKRIDLIRENQRERLGLNPEVETGSGKNQEIVIDVLEYIENSGEFSDHKSEAYGLQKYILGVTNTLCQALQRKDQDILNVVKLVKLTDEALKSYRLEGFDSLLEDVTSFCDKYDIEVVDMEAEYVDPKYRRKKTGITNRHHYVVNNFNTILDMQIQEPGNCFNEERLVYELGHYTTNVKEDKRFANLSGLGDLAKMMVKTRLHVDYPLVYRLIKLSLVLPVATSLSSTPVVEYAMVTEPSGIIRKLMAKTISTSSATRNYENGPKTDLKLTRDQVGRVETSLDVIDITGMDYSLANRKSPIHNLTENKS